MIDFVIGDEEAKYRVKSVEIGENIDSDHHPIKVIIEGRKIGGSRNRGRRKKDWRGVWDKEGKEIFRQRLGK